MPGAGQIRQRSDVVLAGAGHRPQQRKPERIARSSPAKAGGDGYTAKGRTLKERAAKGYAVNQRAVKGRAAKGYAVNHRAVKRRAAKD